MERHQPLAQRDVGVPEDGADNHRKLPLAVVAAPDPASGHLATPGLAPLTLGGHIVVVEAAAVGAHRAGGPTQGFEQFIGGSFVVVDLSDVLECETVHRANHLCAVLLYA